MKYIYQYLVKQTQNHAYIIKPGKKYTGLSKHSVDTVHKFTNIQISQQENKNWKIKTMPLEQ